MRRDFQCDACKKKFPILYMLRNHISLVHEKRETQYCKLCEKHSVVLSISKSMSLQSMKRGKTINATIVEKLLQQKVVLTHTLNKCMALGENSNVIHVTNNFN